jgi:hypothetical protein
MTEFNLAGLDVPKNFITRRKNMNVVFECMVAVIEKLGLEPGQRFESYTIARVLKDSGLDNKWKLSKKPGDLGGLSRTVGDLLGKLGMDLERAGQKFIVPHKMPVVQGEYLIKKAVYKSMFES